MRATCSISPRESSLPRLRREWLPLSRSRSPMSTAMRSPGVASRTSTLADASRSLLASRPTRAVLAGSLADTGDAAIKPAKTMASRVFMNLELRKPSQFITCPDRLCQTTQRIKGLHDNGLPTNGGAKGSSGDFAAHFRLLVLLEGPHAG